MALPEWLVEQLLLTDLRSAGVPPEIGEIGRGYFESESYKQFVAQEENRVRRASCFAEQHAANHPESFPDFIPNFPPMYPEVPSHPQPGGHICVELDDEFDENEMDVSVAEEDI